MNVNENENENENESVCGVQSSVPTCLCGRHTESCPTCLSRSYVVAKARRMTEIQAYLGRLGVGAHTRWERAERHALAAGVAAGTLSHVVHTSVRDAAGSLEILDEDWYSARSPPCWSAFFAALFARVGM
jgi:hypothetical protein